MTRPGPAKALPDAGSGAIIATAERLTIVSPRAFPKPDCAAFAPNSCRCRATSRQARKQLERPIWWVRAIAAAAVIAGAAVFIFVGTILPFDRFAQGGVEESVQGIEASVNTLMLAGLGLLALIRAEETIKRKRVFRELHGLRSLIHVIDMHQLTKDPNVL